MELSAILEELAGLELSGLYERDFTDLPGKGRQELAGVFAAADALGELRAKNYHTAVFASGLAAWEGEGRGENFLAFAAGCEMMGLRVVTLDAVTAQALAALQPDVLCAKSDRGALCDTLYRQGVLTQRPLSLPRETALGLVLDTLHQKGGVGELWGQELPLWPDAPGDLAALAERFGMTAAPRDPEEERQLRVWGLQSLLVAGMILLGKCPDPAGVLGRLQRKGAGRRTV